MPMLAAFYQMLSLGYIYEEKTLISILSQLHVAWPIHSNKFEKIKKNERSENSPQQKQKYNHCL